ncbi:MAG: carbohydrate ABC transporter permease [Janthinobacterium lividum]
MSTPQGTGLLRSAAVAEATVGAASSPRRRAGRAPAAGGGRLERDGRTAYLMLAPIVVLLGIFVIAPFVNAAYISFYDWSFYLPSQFVGFDNYVNIATDPDFLASIGRGLLFALIVVPTGMVLAFVFASVVRGMGGRLASVVKTSIYIPTIMSGVIASIVFTIIYDYSGGVLNAFLGLFGVDPVAWLADPAVALPALTVPAIWIGFGVTALIMLAGMLDIPDTYYEAAALEGASWWQQMVYITIPLLKNVILYLLIAGFTAAIQQFELPLVMTQGGPLNATLLPNLYIFNHFTTDERQGPAIAAALLLFLVLGTISAVIFRLLNSEKSIEG